MGKAIGIDLGTTKSCVGVFHKGKVEIFLNEKRTRTVPNYVSFSSWGEKEVLVGGVAKDQILEYPDKTVFDAKRFIGRKFDDDAVKKNIKHWPFSVKNVNNSPCVSIDVDGANDMISAEVITSKILRKMKRLAEDHLGETVTDAVITVPSCFDNDQRQATKEAAELADLNVLNLLNDSTAAALAYGLDKNLGKDITVLIYDFGASCLDVSVVKLNGRNYEVLSTFGNTQLGGEDIDNILVDYFVRRIRKEFRKDVTRNPKSMRLLRMACERAKRNLSSAKATNVEFSSFLPGLDYKLSISRDQFEEICNDVFDSAIKPVERVLLDAALAKTDINDIILVGGSSKIPKIQKRLKEYMLGKPVNKSITTDESVAYGATIQAALLSGVSDNFLDSISITEVTTHTLGIEDKCGVMSVVVPKNSIIPFKTVNTFSTVFDNQAGVFIKVFDGGRAMVKDNKLFGHFEINGIALAPRGVPQIEVLFEVDADGIFHISAKEVYVNDIDEEESNENKMTNMNNLNVKELTNIFNM